MSLYLVKPLSGVLGKEAVNDSVVIVRTCFLLVPKENVSFRKIYWRQGTSYCTPSLTIFVYIGGFLSWHMGPSGLSQLGFLVTS